MAFSIQNYKNPNTGEEMPMIFNGDHPVFGTDTDNNKDRMIIYLNMLGFDGNAIWKAYEEGTSPPITDQQLEFQKQQEREQQIIQNLASTERGRELIKMVVNALRKPLDESK